MFARPFSSILIGGQYAARGHATVNVSTVWNIAQNALPALLEAVQNWLDELR